MKQKIKKIFESIDLYTIKKPGKAVLVGILLFNICFLFISAFVINRLSPASVKDAGFWASVFYIITMILDAGCIQFVVADVGNTGVAIILACLFIILIGMITFTGAIIGYVSNLISNYIENANSSFRKIKMSDHTIILNWNTRASEIVNDLLYSNSHENIVVLVHDSKEKVEREILDRISDTLSRERKLMMEECQHMSFLKKYMYIKTNYLKNNLTIIVREGDIFSSKQLHDISIDYAKAIIILGRDINNTLCKFEFEEKLETTGRGNSNIIKALIQVADITSAEQSADNQKIVVEVEDEWTLELVNQIIKHKEHRGKCNIVPVPVNRILGQILSQFSIMPELNQVYSELFSNRGAYFETKNLHNDKMNENSFVESYLGKNETVIPLTVMDTQDGKYGYFMVDSKKSIKELSNSFDKNAKEFKVKLNKEFWLKKKNIIILGHNSKITSIMDGFSAFRNEWNLANEEILNVMIIDDKKFLEKNDYFKKYPYVNNVVEADLYDKDIIYNAIQKFSESSIGDTSILVLSDDMALTEEIDANILTYLIYINELIKDKKEQNPNFRTESINVIVEVLNPKNYDVVRSYSVNNVVISNRYISKMITQIGERESIYNFYTDILTYDDENVKSYESKELYIKDACDFFEDLPEKCTAYDLIRAVYKDGNEENKSIVLGYIRDEKENVLFAGNQKDIEVSLTNQDKLIVFSNH